MKHFYATPFMSLNDFLSLFIFSFVLEAFSFLPFHLHSRCVCVCVVVHYSTSIFLEKDEEQGKID